MMRRLLLSVPAFLREEFVYDKRKLKMEPQEPARNDETGGFSMRRISSILKAPRKSAKFPEPEQQEHTVECAKPVEKRSSRRGCKKCLPCPKSFAELMAATAPTPKNRVQVVAAEDEIQPMMGMETNLNSLLHASQQRDGVNFNPAVDFGERTVLFSTDDAFMDMTNSHTINIANDDDICLQDYEVLSSNREIPMIGMIKTQTANLEKENQLPPFASVMLDKSHPSRKVGELSYRSAHCPEDDVSMDFTEAQTGHILGPTDDDDPFQCLFPTQEMYSQSDKRVTQTAEIKSKQQQSSRAPSSSNPKDDEFIDMTQNHTGNIASGPLAPQQMVLDGLDIGFQDFLASLSKPSGSSVNPSISKMMPTAGLSSKHTHSHCESQKREDLSLGLPAASGPLAPQEMVLDGLDLGFKDFLASLSKPSGPRSEKVQSHEVKFEAEDGCREKTVRFTANDAAMNVTQSHTVNIFPGFEPQSVNVDLLPIYGEKTMRFSANDAAMDVTQSHTVSIATGFDPQACQNVDILPTCGEKTMRFTANDGRMDVTRSHTVNIATNLDVASNQNSDSLPTFGEKTVRFSANDAAMDETRSHTANIRSAFEPQSCQYVDGLPTCGEKTMRFSANDAGMDMTQSHTANIRTAFEPQSCPNTDQSPTCGEKTVRFAVNEAGMEMTQSHTANIRTAFESQSCPNTYLSPTCGEKTVRFAVNEAGMEMTQSHTANIRTAFEPRSCQYGDGLPTCGEKTMRFTANECCMDVTRSHTVNIATDLEVASNQNLDSLLTCGEKTMRFSANDAAMDETRSHTVSIAKTFEPQSCQNTDLLPTCGEKTVRFAANDAGMDMTQSHTANIRTAFEPQSCQYVDGLPTCGEKTIRLTANDGRMDVTRSHTVNIATNLDVASIQNLDIPAACLPQPCKNVEEFPACGEKTVSFPVTDAAVDVTQRSTVNVSSSLVSDSVFPRQESNSLSTHGNMDVPLPAKKTEAALCRNRSLSAAGLDLGFKKSLSKISDSEVSVNPVITEAMAPVAPSPQEDVYGSEDMDQLKMQKPNVNTENDAANFVQPTTDKSEQNVMTESLENSECDMSKVQTGSVLGQIYTEEVYSNPDDVEIKNNPDSFDVHTTKTRKEPDLRNETTLISQKSECSPSASDKDADTLHSRKSRRISLANLQSKIRRLSHKINTAPDTVTESCTLPLPQLDQDSDKNSPNKTRCLPKEEPEPEQSLENAEDKTAAQCPKEAEEPSTAATPYNLKTTQLMSVLSVGRFKPKLPQRKKSDDTKTVGSVGEHTRTFTANVTGQLSDLHNDISDIYDEELDSCEDMSENLDSRSPQKVTDKVSCSREVNMDDPLKEYISDEDFMTASRGLKRPLPQDDIDMEDEKSVKTFTDTDKMELQSHDLECDGTIRTASTVTTQSADLSNNSHTSSIRCEATFESTFKRSMFESQLEDYGSDVNKKFDDGTITVSEFLKLFSIDFVIHNPRQSVLPGKRLSDTGRTSMDLLKDRYINRPKQVVYETDVLNLTEKVEGLKFRLRDLDKPLRLVNRPLWEEMRRSSEKELKSFGVKLKERNNLFRKASKTRSHELKEVLYSNLVQANLREQQKLRSMNAKADAMIKSLDDCIHQLETELAEVEERGSDDKLSLKSCQEELKNVAEAVAVNEQKMCELEMQKKQNSHNFNRVKAETRDLENCITLMHTVNEWKLGKKEDNYTVYTFLYDTLNLHVVLDKFNGNDAENGSEYKISEIAFKFLLDDEKAKCNARLVHKLLSPYFEEESDWVEKYPTSRHVPKLLHDVGLVVSRCRQLGEELRLLKMWGSLRFDILDIHCVDTEVHIVFSSLKKFAKFEVVFSISLINQLYVLQLQSFKNKIGTTTIQQIEETVASFSPGRKLLTKIVKKIHEDLLV
ncbi:hypothetical protein Q5P01_004703 [Channa striata]|uniref:Knl1 C-terminal RWD domain-containing protein n=1 Tax=Channa striata TaxID=64152 RepID=A0AA88SXU0_CHASR|nr:hypothetical protein Q5P01_004703 [Channa striata]